MRVASPTDYLAALEVETKGAKRVGLVKTMNARGNMTSSALHISFIRYVHGLTRSFWIFEQIYVH